MWAPSKIEKEMKKLVIFIIGIISLAACDVESSDNGQLDGFWQWCQIDTLATGGITDMRKSRIFWDVGFDLLEIRNTDDFSSQVLFRFVQTSKTLLISSPVIKNREVGDIRIQDPQELNTYGIYDLTEQFHIECLNRNKMVLRNERFRFHFRKY
jgi:hypothetical protein